MAVGCTPDPSDDFLTFQLFLARLWSEFPRGPGWTWTQRAESPYERRGTPGPFPGEMGGGNLPEPTLTAETLREVTPEAGPP